MSKRMRDSRGYLVWRVYCFIEERRGVSSEWAVDILAPSEEDAETAAHNMFSNATSFTVEEAP